MDARRTTPHRMTAHALIVAVLLMLSSVVAPGAAVAAPLGITLAHARPSSVELRVVCPIDPPTNVLVFRGADQPVLIGHAAMSCVGGGVEQLVTVPLDEPLIAGMTVDLSATVSGDSGEINAWFPGSVVEPEAGPGTIAPSVPTHVRVRAGSTRLVVTWRAPVASPGAPVDGFRLSCRSRTVSTGPTAHRAVFSRLTPGRRYVIRLVAFNQVGDSPHVTLAVRTRR